MNCNNYICVDTLHRIMQDDILEGKAPSCLYWDKLFQTIVPSIIGQSVETYRRTYWDALRT